MFHLQIRATLVIVFGMILLTFAATTEREFNTGHFQNQYLKNRGYYGSRYYKNTRDYNNNRQYYENYLRTYNPNVAEAQARIIVQDVKTPQNGVYSYYYKTENGIHAEEHGVPVQDSKDNSKQAKQVVQGSYSFVTPEGIHILVRYTADENGFHPIITYGDIHPTQLTRHVQSTKIGVNKSN